MQEKYNKICTKLPQAQKITDKRSKLIERFLKDFSVEEFEEICKKANVSNFLTGINDNCWKADFDFLLRIDKANSILEGKYDNEKKGNEPMYQQSIFGDMNRFYDNLEQKRVKNRILGRRGKITRLRYLKRNLTPFCAKLGYVRAGFKKKDGG